TAPPTADAGGSLVLFRSTDDGATWTLASAALPGGDASAQLAGRATLATAESTVPDSASARIYLLAATVDGGAQLDLFRSDDGGLSFQALHVNASRRPENPNPDAMSLDVLGVQAWYNQALLVDAANPDGVFIGGQLAIIRSLDAGRTWSVLSDWLPNNSANANIDRAYVHADLHAFAVGADGLFYAGSDGGISVSPNALSSPAKDVIFTSAHNEGLVTHLAYSVACAPESWPDSPATKDFVVAGSRAKGPRVGLGYSTVFTPVVRGAALRLPLIATTRFITLDSTTIGLRNLAAHPGSTQVWAAVSNRYAYMTNDGGSHWLVGIQQRPQGSAGGTYLLSSIEFDPRDASGRTYYVTSLATALIDADGNFYPYPTDFGHVFRTDNGGATW